MLRFSLQNHFSGCILITWHTPPPVLKSPSRLVLVLDDPSMVISIKSWICRAGKQPQDHHPAPGPAQDTPKIPPGAWERCPTAPGAQGWICDHIAASRGYEQNPRCSLALWGVPVPSKVFILVFWGPAPNPGSSCAGICSARSDNLKQPNLGQPR